MDIFLYAFSVMYSPGPVNFMGLNAGLTGQFRRSTGFFAGVGCAMLVLFVLFGYTGEAIISHAALPYICLVGGVYTLYLAYQCGPGGLCLFHVFRVLQASECNVRRTCVCLK
ncbi:hypothetical protein SAMN04490198_5314 [Pseudomonas palleroniana]|uniref:Lysine transporter LysE n=1 Tax=Pseudomonas palleroniana TaxID=191390 RepID=A0A1H5P5G1_9PSED|nr:hypothetical protein SAMN04490198_5314 [Pseudomonas palleroniana]